MEEDKEQQDARCARGQERQSLNPGREGRGVGLTWVSEVAQPRSETQLRIAQPRSDTQLRISRSSAITSSAHRLALAHHQRCSTARDRETPGTILNVPQRPS